MDKGLEFHGDSWGFETVSSLSRERDSEMSAEAGAILEVENTAVDVAVVRAPYCLIELVHFSAGNPRSIG